MHRKTARAAAALRSTTVEGDDLGDLLFGQQHLGTHDYFCAHFGQSHTVPLRDFPHTAFLTDPDSGRPVFDDYLNRSWSYGRPEQNTADLRRHHMERFLDRKQGLISGRRNEKPALVYRRRDGQMVIVDGNHRTVLAYVLGFPIRLQVMSPRQWLSETAVRSGTFFGAGHRSMPYQSLFSGSEEVVRGRRTDTRDRLLKVRSEDVFGQRVLDLGSNIGATSFAAADRGARDVVGIEVDPQMVSSALRLNSYFAASVEFVVHDLNKPYISDDAFDTLFCFSVAAHVPTLIGLEWTIRNSGIRTMYFEAHVGKTAEDYPTLLDEKVFGTIELVGLNESGDPGDGGKRAFYRCEV